jgi:hypothetical protein
MLEVICRDLVYLYFRFRLKEEENDSILNSLEQFVFYTYLKIFLTFLLSEGKKNLFIFFGDRIPS